MGKISQRKTVTAEGIPKPPPDLGQGDIKVEDVY